MIERPRMRRNRARAATVTWVRASWARPALFALAFVVVAGFAVYTYLVIRTLRAEAQRFANVYAESILSRVVQDPTLTGPELDVLFDLIRGMPVSVILSDENGVPQQWKGIAVPDTARSEAALAEVRRIARDMDRRTPPREVVLALAEDNLELRWYIHVAESSFLRRVAWMPVVATIVTLLIAAVALWGYREIKTGEQQALWVGMAKETAHQLGTPLSSLSGWLELLRELETTRDRDGERASYVVGEMANDIERLRKIAQRFGQIGSPPELDVQPVAPLLDETISYMRTRAPRLGRDVAIERDYRVDEEVPHNRELLGWAFENLLKNALDAFPRDQNRPLIRVTTERHDRWLVIAVSDNGRGIPAKDLPRVFLPGFSTKKRGWGLGLTFVKRIIEDYHGGSIAAFSAGQGQGTVVEIRLPIARRAT